MRTAALAIAAALLLSGPTKAQDKTDTAVYKVDFNIRDGQDTTAKAGRRYTLLARNNNKSVFKVGDRIPYANTSGPQETHYSYLDTGVNIECIARESNGKVALYAELDMTALVPGPRPTAGPNPVVAQTHFSINTVLSPGQPMLVASFDDPVTTRKLDVEATISKVD